MNNIQYPNELIIKTTTGLFHYTISKNIGGEKREVISYTINIGGKDNKCVQINVPVKTSSEKYGYLMWVESDDTCSLEKYIIKGIAQHMTLLGFTIARELNPTLKGITLKDTSNFECKLPDGKEQNVQMKMFHIAFHGATWYEYYFNAVLDNQYDTYLKLKENLYREDKKKKEFDFGYPQYTDELKALYDSTKTWHEFFTAIATKYGNKKCAVVYPWLLFAMYDIFENNNIFENILWHIDFQDNDRVPLIPFTSYEVKKQKGGVKTKTKTKTKKNKNPVYKTCSKIPNKSDVIKWDLKRFLY